MIFCNPISLHQSPSLLSETDLAILILLSHVLLLLGTLQRPIGIMERRAFHSSIHPAVVLELSQYRCFGTNEDQSIYNIEQYTIERCGHSLARFYITPLQFSFKAVTR